MRLPHAPACQPWTRSSHADHCRCPAPLELARSDGPRGSSHRLQKQENPGSRAVSETRNWMWVRLLILLLTGAFAVPFVAAQKPPARPQVPENVIFETGIEYANPDGQHLQLD